MSPRTKLILQITGFILAIIFIGWLVWAVFFRSSGAPLIPGQTGPTEQGSLPTIGEGGQPNVVQEGGNSLLVPEAPTPEAGPSAVASGGRTTVEALTDSRAEFSTLSAAGGNFNYYDERDGRFYRLSPNGGEPVKLSDEVFNNVQNVTWAAKSDSAVLEFPDGSNIFYNFKTKEKATLPKAAQDFSFSPTDDQIAYKYVGQAEADRWIVTSAPNGQGQTLVNPIGDEFNRVAVSWSPTNQVVATYRNVTSSAGEEVFFIGRNDENFKSLQTNGLGFKGEWSPSGDQILYSVYSQGTDYNPELFIAGGSGDNIGAGNRSLRLSTWPDKCAFAGESLLYCAVPQSLEQGSGLYPELAANVPDTIYKVDLNTNVASPIAFPEAGNQSSFTVNKLMVAPDKSQLYFTDQVTGRIQRLRLR